MAFTHPHINAYVIVGGDSDFLSLVEKLKQYDKKVFVVGGRAFTSIILQRNCHEFIAYENLAGVRKPAAKIGRPMPAAAASSPIAQAFPIVRRALKILADREVSPQTGLLKSTLLQLDSTFSERNYGASSFLDFVEKLSQAGLVQLKHSGRSVMVELNEGFADEANAAALRRRPPRRRRRRPRTSISAAAATARPPSRRPPDVAQMFRAAEDQAARYEDGEPLARPRCRRRPARSARPRAPKRRAARRQDPLERDDRALADVSAQREADPAAGRRRLRRAPLRVRRADGSAEGVSARGVRPDRARSPRRAARVPGRRRCRERQSTAAAQPIEIMDVEPIETQPGESIETSEPVETERAARWSRFRSTRPRSSSDAPSRGSRARARAAPGRRPTPTPRASAQEPAGCAGDDAAKAAKKAAAPRPVHAEQEGPGLCTANDDNE